MINTSHSELDGDDLISINRISKSFGDIRAVDDISFTVSQGDVLAFLGPNGAGKSTTMKILTGYLQPDAGAVTFNDLDVAAHAKEVKKQIGYLPEGMPLYGDMPVLSFLRFIGETRNIRGESLKRGIARVVSEVKIENVLSQRIETLSKGYQRRVGLAQALLHDPKYLVLDEPTDGLDPNQKAQVRQLVRKISKDKAIILSTHILEEVEAVCNRVIIISNGRIMKDTTADELVASAGAGGAIRLQVKGLGGATVKSKLSTITENAQVSETRNDWVRIVSDDCDRTIRQINEIARSNDWTIQSLATERGNLDEVFRQITQ